MNRGERDREIATERENVATRQRVQLAQALGLPVNTGWLDLIQRVSELRRADEARR